MTSPSEEAIERAAFPHEAFQAGTMLLRSQAGVTTVEIEFHDRGPGVEVYEWLQETACCPLPDPSAEIAALRAQVADLETYSHALQVALTGLTRQGSEFFVKHGDGFRADIPACVADVRGRQENAHKRTVKAVCERKDAEALVAELREALEPFAAAYAFWNDTPEGVHDDCEIDDHGQDAIRACRRAAEVHAKTGSE